MTSYVPSDFGPGKSGPQILWWRWRLSVHGFLSNQERPLLTWHLHDQEDTQRLQLAQGWKGTQLGGGADGLPGFKSLAVGAGEPKPSIPQPTGLDLTDWKWTGPIDSNGDGKADEVKQPTLDTFKLTPYFYVRADGGTAFRAPCDGVTTSTNTAFARSELREMENGGRDVAAWDSDDGVLRSLEVDLMFTHLPEIKPHVVGIQIHNGSDDVTTLRLEGTDLWVTKGDAKYKKIAAGYQLNTRIRVRVEVTPAGIRWFLNGNWVATIDGTYEDCFWKAGCYTQASSRVPKTSDKYGEGYGEVVIYDLDKRAA